MTDRDAVAALVERAVRERRLGRVAAEGMKQLPLDAVLVMLEALNRPAYVPSIYVPTDDERAVAALLTKACQDGRITEGEAEAIAETVREHSDTVEVVALMLDRLPRRRGRVRDLRPKRAN